MAARVLRFRRETNPVTPPAVRLEGLRALVADDDPAVSRHLSALLAAQGCTVTAVGDGAAALDCAFARTPDLVLADLRMPGLEGQRLADEMRSDPVLRDVPVVFLSWKEDWLARARERASGPTGYLTKESAPETAVACFRRVLQEGADLDHRLHGDSSVRGSLEDVTPDRLLRIVGRSRADARVSVRDGIGLYDIHLRGGDPLTATTVAMDGTVLRGSRALDAFLQLRRGRFVVASERGPVQADLRGSLARQLASHLSDLRAGGAAPLDETTEPMDLPAARAVPITLRLPLPPPRPWPTVDRTLPLPPPLPPVLPQVTFPVLERTASRAGRAAWMRAALVAAAGIAGLASGVLLRALQSV